MSEQDKRVFLSYSHDDSELALRLAHALTAKGENLFVDKWDILAGDSIVEKVFETGLKNAKAVVVLLSSSSVNSSWVRHELDVATVNRINGITRIIPVLIDAVDVPVALRALRRVDLRTNFDQGVQQIVEALTGVAGRPAISARPLDRSLPGSIGGLSRGATAVAIELMERSDYDAPGRIAMSGTTLAEATTLSAEAVSDAVEELEEQGIVRVLRAIGTSPFRFLQCEPTYQLFHELKLVLPYDPMEDAHLVAAAVASAESVSAVDLLKVTKLSIGRQNRAAEFLRDSGVVEASRELGTYPHSYAYLMATRRTREFVAEHGGHQEGSH